MLRSGGAEGIRTPDPHNAIVVLYQLSYDPTRSGRQFKSTGGIVKVCFFSGRWKFERRIKKVVRL
jgi:hypothetical protein